MRPDCRSAANFTAILCRSADPLFACYAGRTTMRDAPREAAPGGVAVARGGDRCAPGSSCNASCFVTAHGRAGLGRRGCGLRRHRHQPAVHAQGGIRSAWRAGLARQRARRPEPGVLVADHRGVGEISAVHHARRQQGRGRHHGAYGAGPALHPRPPAAALGRGAAGAVRRRAVLRRRRDHAGDLGAVGGGGPEGRHAGAGALRGADHRGRDPGPGLVAAARHRAHRRGVRAGLRGVVRLHRRAGRARHRAASGGAVRPAADLRHRVLHPQPCRGLLRPRRGGAGGDRHRGAVRRHGALRSGADPAGLVQLRAAGAAAELLRSGRAGADEPGHGDQPVLSPGAAVAAVPDDRTGHGGHGHRLAGGDFRRVLDDPRGDAARLRAAHAGGAYLAGNVRAGLRAVDQPRAGGADRAGRRRLPLLGQPGLGLRHRGDRHDGDHDAAGAHRGTHPVALELGGGDRHRRRPAGGGPGRR